MRFVFISLLALIMMFFIIFLVHKEILPGFFDVIAVVAAFVTVVVDTTLNYIRSQQPK